VDSCGVGMVAQLKGVPSHEVVRDANTMLVRMAHRGGCGCDPASGDGAGILTGMPDSFLRQAVHGELGATLPPLGQYAAGVVFFPKDSAAIAACKAAVEKQLEVQGLGLVGWRPLPVDNSELGPTSKESEPHSEMLLVTPSAEGKVSDFGRELWRLRISAGQAIHKDPANDDFYINSLNAGTIVYKGQLTPEQVWGYFTDLQSPEYQSHLALVHSRFSTNTFPSWARAQPFRSLCHNGEINTLRGNKNMMSSREAALVSEYFSPEVLDSLKPICSDNMSDSGNFDAVAELLMHGGERPIHEAVMMMVSAPPLPHTR
jgi:glutamate synthase domain-containing protein 1